MAVDTRDKRASCLGIARTPPYVLPNPGTIDQPDRQQLAYAYPGITAGSISPTDYFELYRDWNTSALKALEDRYGITLHDLETLLARFLAEHPEEDSTLAFAKLELIIRGLLAVNTP